MSNARAEHECSKISRFGRDYVVVIGGYGLVGNVLTVEYYDLKAKPSSWETVSGISCAYLFTYLFLFLNWKKT